MYWIKGNGIIESQNDKQRFAGSFVIKFAMKFTIIKVKHIQEIQKFNIYELNYLLKFSGYRF